MKTLRREQLEKRKTQAARFARDVREDDDLADAIEDESLEEYAQKRRITLSNPNSEGGRYMPVPTRSELIQRIRDLKEENRELQDRLDQISDLVTPEEEGDEDEDSDRD